MRFAWLRKNSANNMAVKQGCTHPLAVIRLAYNAAFWIFLLPFFTVVDYTTGFIAFTGIIVIRLGLNLYANQIIKRPAQYESFPFRP